MRFRETEGGSKDPPLWHLGGCEAASRGKELGVLSGMGCAEGRLQPVHVTTPASFCGEAALRRMMLSIEGRVKDPPSRKAHGSLPTNPPVSQDTWNGDTHRLKPALGVFMSLKGQKNDLVT